MNVEFKALQRNIRLFSNSTSPITPTASTERMQLQILRQSIDLNPTLRRAVQDKDWDKIAFYYNGPRYAENHYQIKLKDAYEKL